MNYGSLPAHLGYFENHTDEMFFYQYLPIKFVGNHNPIYENRLKCFDKLIGKICCDFIGEFGLNAYMDSNVYLTAKRLFVTPECGYNRPGYHSDGFGTSDINYIWSDRFPTIFNTSKFVLSENDILSLEEMDKQAKKQNEIHFFDNSILRLNQYNIHKCGEVTETTIRTFVKVSFSGDKYDLKGNSHNYKLNYNWEMKDRKLERNIPQSNINKGFAQIVKPSDNRDQ